MKILVLGAGRSGARIAYSLLERNIDVILLDKSQTAIENIDKHLISSAYQCDTFDIESLSSMDMEDITHVIAVLPDDEKNILACKIVKELFGVASAIARIRSKKFFTNQSVELFIKDNFGIDYIMSPEKVVSDVIGDILSIPYATNVIYFLNFVIFSISCTKNSDLLNTPLKLIDSITDIPFYIASIKREGRTFIPTANDEIKRGDEVSIITSQDYINDILKLLGYDSNIQQNICIVGGGKVCTSLINNISKFRDYNISVIEKNYEQARLIAENYSNVNVIHGDANNSDLLKDIAYGCDAVAVLTNEDSINVLCSLCVKRLNVPRIITINAAHHYNNLLPSEDGFVVIDANAITVDAILKNTKTEIVSKIASIGSYFITCSMVSNSCAYIGYKVSSIIPKKLFRPILILHNDIITNVEEDTKLNINDIVIAITSVEGLEKSRQIFTNYFYTKNITQFRSNYLEEDDEIDKLIDEDDEELLS